MEKIYDVIIIGAGPSGLTAGLYAARDRMSTLVLEKEKPGGQIATTDEVANYPGSIENATGPDLVARMVEQCKEFGAEIEKDTIQEVNLEDKIKVLTGDKGTYKAKSVIVATGATPRKLGAPGEVELTGKGVSYCATCDADFFSDFEVFCIGGGDSAVEEAIHLSKFARKVTIVHRREELKAAKSIQEKAFKNEKIDFIWNTQVKEIKGDGMVESIVFENLNTGEVTEHEADEEDGTFGIFIFVGYIPETDLFKGKMELSKAGYIITNDNMHTDIPGVFAAGDVREKTLRQVATAVGDGAVAAIQAEKYIEHAFEE
ncbi:thioredoxin-disulfide reductase [Isachenkonia alkalipeptolytica]|uniref:Thioredoxin reductase n=1 Tax=Isachenkonia alkalipeptolytica TaxID=2565777 RepID=A0AA43XNU5_9CLOT|nr:thioredoxin-disulfide reductase [Isachenkonia alkalipeptolytica]NBG89180.1 thioredoxin-disulfide reductase [Isachenkonia alkalipeptolytica]